MSSRVTRRNLLCFGGLCGTAYLASCYFGCRGTKCRLRRIVDGTIGVVVGIFRHNAEPLCDACFNGQVCHVHTPPPPIPGGGGPPPAAAAGGAGGNGGAAAGNRAAPNARPAHRARNNAAGGPVPRRQGPAGAGAADPLAQQNRAPQPGAPPAGNPDPIPPPQLNNELNADAALDALRPLAGWYARANQLRVPPLADGLPAVPPGLDVLINFVAEYQRVNQGIRPEELNAPGDPGAVDDPALAMAPDPPAAAPGDDDAVRAANRRPARERPKGKKRGVQIPLSQSVRGAAHAGLGVEDLAATIEQFREEEITMAFRDRKDTRDRANDLDDVKPMTVPPIITVSLPTQDFRLTRQVRPGKNLGPTNVPLLSSLTEPERLHWSRELLGTYPAVDVNNPGLLINHKAADETMLPVLPAIVAAELDGADAIRLNHLMARARLYRQQKHLPRYLEPSSHCLQNCIVDEGMAKLPVLVINPVEHVIEPWDGVIDLLWRFICHREPRRFVLLVDPQLTAILRYNALYQKRDNKLKLMLRNLANRHYGGYDCRNYTAEHLFRVASNTIEYVFAFDPVAMTGSDLTTLPLYKQRVSKVNRPFAD